jgi:hypothetical protein
MINTIKKEMAIGFLRHYVRFSMIKNNIPDERAAMDKILTSLPILAFSGDQTEKIGASFIAKNKELFNFDILYPANGVEIKDFENLFNVPASAIDKKLPLETCTFISLFHGGEELRTLCRDFEYGIEDDVFRLFPKKISWKDIRKKEFSETFIIENVENVDWDVICRQPLTEEIMRKYADKINFNTVSQCQHLSEDFMDYFKSKLNWSYLSCHQVMSQKFIADNAKLVDWLDIIKYQQIEETFIDENATNIPWASLAESKPNLSMTFIKKHRNELGYKQMAEYQSLDEDFIEENYSHFSRFGAIEKLFSYQKLSKSFIDKHNDDIVSKRYTNKPQWETLFCNQKITHFDFKGTTVYKYVDIDEIKTIINCHKGPVMVLAKNSEMYYRTVYVNNKNVYRIVCTTYGYKSWEKCRGPLGSGEFTLTEVIALIKTTIKEAKTQ